MSCSARTSSVQSSQARKIRSALCLHAVSHTPPHNPYTCSRSALEVSDTSVLPLREMLDTFSGSSPRLAQLDRSSASVGGLGPVGLRMGERRSAALRPTSRQRRTWSWGSRTRCSRRVHSVHSACSISGAAPIQSCEMASSSPGGRCTTHLLIMGCWVPGSWEVSQWVSARANKVPVPMLISHALLAN